MESIPAARAAAADARPGWHSFHSKHGRHSLLLLIALCTWAPQVAAQTTGAATAPEQATVRERKVALVIGNGAYETSALKNPVNDARAVAKMLRELGFDVLLRENVTEDNFTEALRAFGTRLKPGGVSLFYFAGHGMQVGGRNYLIPVGASIENEDEVPYRAIDANQVLDKMGRANSTLNLVILDACRNNPFTRSFRAQINGLAHMEAPSGTLIAFATSPGSVAADGDGTNSTYTKHLLTNIAAPGVPVEIALKRVREGVSRETLGRQIPWESSSMMGDFYFRPGEAKAQVALAETPEMRFAAEKAFWESIQDKGGSEEYLAYLRQYPNGRFAVLAKARLSAEQAKAAAATAAPAGPNDTFDLAYWESIKNSKDPADFKAYLEQFPKGKFAGLARNRIGAQDTQVANARSTTPGSSGATDGLPKIGDSWTYNLMQGGKRVIDTVSMTVTDVDGGRIQDKVTYGNSRSFGAVRTFKPGFSPDAGLQETGLPGKYMLVEFSPYVSAAGVPAAGTDWKDLATTLTIDGPGQPKVNVSISVRAAGMEYVRVAAGEFNTLRVEVRGRRSDARSADDAGDLVLTYWYSPEVRRAVKMSIRSGSKPGSGAGDSLELLGYHQSR